MINLACGDSISLLDLIRDINTLLGTNIEPNFEAPRAGDIKHSCADISLARDLLGFSPVVDFREGLRRTLEWLKDN